MKTYFSKNKGFTIIELLVVIAIIAILTGIVMTNLLGSKAKARDAKRVSDLGQIQLALELYFDRCKHYPYTLDIEEEDNDCTVSGGTVNLGTFLPKIPVAPAVSNLPYSDQYYYFPNTYGGYQQYYLLVRLESNNPALSDDVDGPFWEDAVNCDDPNYCLTD
ncbi:MAG: hypothetical protein RLY66_593 [Candidatus Parcubacteria bacterium]|jgi:prepilin-type N-terminal cleavage/methylation domain-containing protein